MSCDARPNQRLPRKRIHQKAIGEIKMNEKLNYKHHKIYFVKPEKCRRPIGATECNSKKFLKHDSFVKLRGVLCTHYKCKKCDADYFVAVKISQIFGV